VEDNCSGERWRTESDPPSVGTMSGRLPGNLQIVETLSTRGWPVLGLALASRPNLALVRHQAWLRVSRVRGMELVVPVSAIHLRDDVLPPRSDV